MNTCKHVSNSAYTYFNKKDTFQVYLHFNAGVIHTQAQQQHKASNSNGCGRTIDDFRWVKVMIYDVSCTFCCRPSCNILSCHGAFVSLINEIDSVIFLNFFEVQLFYIEVNGLSGGFL